MPNPETILTRRIVRALEATGCIVIKQHGSGFAREGFPDLVVVRGDGVVAFVEVKIPGRTDGPAGCGLSAMQLRWLWRLAEQGARAGWADSPEDAMRVVWGSRRSNVCSSPVSGV